MKPRPVHVSVSVLAVASLAWATACGGPCECDVVQPGSGPGSGTGTGTGQSDAEVEEGAGWKRTAPGTWQFAVDADRFSDTALVMSPGGRAVFVVPLPAGARAATLSKVLVTYLDAGDGVWTLNPLTADGYPGDPIASVKATIAVSTWAELAFDPPPTVSDRVTLVFEATGGAPTIGAINAPMAEARVRYQAPGDMLNNVPMTPLVRIVLTNVH